MSKIRIIAPALTVLFKIAYHLIVTANGWTFTVSGLWFFMVVAAYVSGFRAALVAATWAAFYAYYAVPADWVQQVVWGFLIAGAVGFLRRQEQWERELVDADLSNGNVEKVTRALENATQLSLQLGSGTEQHRLARDIVSDLGNSLAVMIEFHKIWHEIQEVERWYRTSGNIFRWQSWRRAKK